MTLTDLLNQLDAVRPRCSGRWSARCPAHADRSPSLSLSEGNQGILLRCWAGCTVEEITGALGLTVKDLFFDGQPDPVAMVESRRRREARERMELAAGCHADTLRDAEQVILTARNLDISRWSDAQLDRSMNAIAGAHAILNEQGADYYEWLAKL